MRIARSIADLPGRDRPVALAIGNFDGVHLGHQAVLGSTHEAARARGGEAWVLTFDPHPVRVLRPAAAPPLLTTPAQREERLRAEGMDGWWIRPFDAAFAALSPEDFWRALRAALPTLAALRVGENWRFGRGASGNLETLRALGAEDGVEVLGLPGVSWRGQPVSSTRIRDALRIGDCETAAALLGRPYELSGTVVHGTRFARTLGFPSANLQTANEVLPPDGIYRCECELDGEPYLGAGYIPVGRPHCEVHLLGFSGDAYGRTLRVGFTHRLRPDRRIEDLDELKAQIAEDVRQVGAWHTLPPARG